MRPLGATASVPNQCRELGLMGSLFTLMGSGSHVTPLSVLRLNMTRIVWVTWSWTEQRAYTQPRLGPVERSTSTQTWPMRPPGFAAPPVWAWPRRLTFARVNVGGIEGSPALAERETETKLAPVLPAM